MSQSQRNLSQRGNSQRVNSQKNNSRRSASQRQSSQPSSSQRSVAESSQRSRADDLSEEQFEAAVLNVTNFLLCEMRSKRKVKKDDVVVNALNKSSRQYGAIMKRVYSNLHHVFGLQIVKLSSSDDSFIIVNLHKKDFTKLTLQLTSDEDIQEDIILTVALSSIFMNRGQLYQSHLMAILETMGCLNDSFYRSSEHHIHKDYVPKLIKQVFVKQLYLDAVVVPRPDQIQTPPLPENEKKVTVYQWGFRAYLEADVDKIVNYLVKIFDGRKPPGFPSTYYMELKAKQKELRSQAHLDW